MPRQTKRDNATLKQKIALRQRALAILKERGIAPVILEAFGGGGELWKACYSHVPHGAVFEIADTKIEKLARQRPSWSVYQADCVTALAAGVADHLTFTLIDADPYGSVLPVLDAVFSHPRPLSDTLVLVTNDGARQAVQVGISWKIGLLKPYVERFGNDLYPVYREVLAVAIEDYAARAGYAVESHASLYSGAHDNMAHGLTVLVRGKQKAP